MRAATQGRPDKKKQDPSSPSLKERNNKFLPLQGGDVRGGWVKISIFQHRRKTS
jgi:hypothetical protein